MSTMVDHRDGPRDECGVFGIYAPERDVARLTYFALFAEAPGRAFVVSGPADQLGGLRIIGRVGGSELIIEGALKLAVSELRNVRERGLEQLV